MRNVRTALAAILLVGGSVAIAAAADVVILRGGSRIELQGPVMQKGNTAILTRADGTLLSVPMTEIDWQATAAAKSSGPAPVRPAVVAPPSTPSDALRSPKGEKARVKVTDADVGHVDTSGSDNKIDSLPMNAPKVEVGEYTQTKNGSNLIVNGVLHNPGSVPVTGTRMTVSAVDENGNVVSSASATVSNGTIEGGRTVGFGVTIPTGDRIVAQLRFSPQWITPAAPAAGSSAAPAASASGAMAASADAAASKPPAPAPTPYGRGTLYAPPAANAPSTPPDDNRNGYLPGASTPENQPKNPQ